MSNKQDKKGRDKHADGHYFQMYEWFMKTSAWQHASVYERALYLELKRRYNGRNNGGIPLSHREGQKLLGCSNKPVAAAFKGLQAKGFIKVQTKGSFHWKVSHAESGGRSTRWELTELPRDIPMRVLAGGSKEFMHWRPDIEEKENSRHAHSTPVIRLEQTISELMISPEHTMHAGAYANGRR